MIKETLFFSQNNFVNYMVERIFFLDQSNGGK